MGRNLVVYLFLFGLFQTQLVGQIANDPLGARSTSMAGISTTISDTWSVNNNQAGLGFAKELTAGIHYQNRFLLNETAYRSVALVLPTNSGGIGASVTSFGFSDFTETKVGLSYGQRFGDGFALGIQFNYLNTNLGETYGSKSSVIGAFGFIANLTKELTIGVHIYNPTRTKLAKFDNERLQTVMKLGLDYRFSEKVIFAIETEKNTDFGAVLKVGIEYHILEQLYLRMGISNNPTKSAFGVGIELKDFSLELSSLYDPTLGITPGISLIYRKPKSDKQLNSK